MGTAGPLSPLQMHTTTRDRLLGTRCRPASALKVRTASRAEAPGAAWELWEQAGLALRALGRADGASRVPGGQFAEGRGVGAPAPQAAPEREGVRSRAWGPRAGLKNRGAVPEQGPAATRCGRLLPVAGWAGLRVCLRTEAYPPTPGARPGSLSPAPRTRGPAGRRPLKARLLPSLSGDPGGKNPRRDWSFRSSTLNFFFFFVLAG